MDRVCKCSRKATHNVVTPVRERESPYLSLAGIEHVCPSHAEEARKEGKEVVKRRT